MSVIFKPTKMKYKDPNNNTYVGINAVTDEATRPVINDWLDDHPEATTTVQDDSITNIKIKDQNITVNKLDANETRFPFTFDHDGRHLLYIGNKSGFDLGVYTDFQGACLVGNNRILCFTKSSLDTGFLMELDSNNAGVRRSEVFEMGHGNDLTYNPNTRKIYIINEDIVVEFDYDDFTVTRNISIERAMGNIAYSEKYDMYFGNKGQNIICYNSDFEFVESFNPNFRNQNVVGTKGYNGQGLAVLGDKLIMCANAVSGDRYIYDILLTIDLRTKKYIAYNRYLCELPNSELEAIDFTPDGLMMGFSGGGAIRLYLYEYDGVQSIETINDPNVLVPLTTASYNVNNIRRENKLYEYGNGSFTNVPTHGMSGQKTLRSIGGGNDYYYQTLTDPNGREYRRTLVPFQTPSAWLGVALSNPDGTIDAGHSYMTFKSYNLKLSDMQAVSSIEGRYHYQTDIPVSGVSNYIAFASCNEPTMLCQVATSGGYLQLRISNVIANLGTDTSLTYKIFMFAQRV